MGEASGSVVAINTPAIFRIAADPVQLINRCRLAGLASGIGSACN
jgi:hypothetical protein